jgi:hypothetical protein
MACCRMQIPAALLMTGCGSGTPTGTTEGSRGEAFALMQSPPGERSSSFGTPGSRGPSSIPSMYNETPTPTPVNDDDLC